MPPKKEEQWVSVGVGQNDVRADQISDGRKPVGAKMSVSCREAIGVSELANLSIHLL